MKLLKVMLGNLWRDTKNEPAVVRIAVGIALLFMLVMPGIIMLLSLLLAMEEEYEEKNDVK